MTVQTVAVDAERLRLIIVGDNHGYIDHRIADLSRTCDIAVHTGDIIALEVLQQLRPSSGKIYAVKGNNDADKNNGGGRHGLPDQYRLSLPGGILCVEHGHRIWDTRNYSFRLRQKYQQVGVSGRSRSATRINWSAIGKWNHGF